MRWLLSVALLMFCSQAFGATYNVRDYGAVGDGTTNDAEAFADAVDEVNTNGGTLYIPQGTYQLGQCDTARIHIKRSGVTIKGDGMGRTVLKFKMINRGDNSPGEYLYHKGTCICLGNNSTWYEHITVEGLTLRDEQTEPTWGGSGIWVMFISNCSIKGVEIIDTSSGGITAIHSIYGPDANGLCYPTGKNLRIEGCYVHTSANGKLTGDGINCGNFDGFWLLNNRIEGRIMYFGFEGGWLKNAQIVGNVVDINPDQPHGLGAMGSMELENAEVRGNVLRVKRVGSFGIGLDSDHMNIAAGINCKIIGNDIEAYQEAVRIQSSNAGKQKDIQIIGNRLKAAYPISVWYNTPLSSLLIQNNILDLKGVLGQGVAFALAGAPGAEVKGLVIVQGNVVINGLAGNNPPGYVVSPFTSNWWPRGNDPKVIVQNNTVAQ